MIKERKYVLTNALLKDYGEAALSNARDLVVDAELLLNQSRFARAYFLSCASIEESGKALLAFQAINRSLQDSALQNVVKMQFERHDIKIAMGISSLRKNDDFDSASIDAFLETAFDIYFGREKSIYVDITDDNQVTIPNTILNMEIARNALSLSKDVLQCIGEQISHNGREVLSKWADKALLISSNAKKFKDMLKLKDFQMFYFSLLRESRSDPSSNDSFFEAVVRYSNEYYGKKVLWSNEKKK